MSTEIPGFGRKPHTAGWLIGAIIFSFPPIVLAAYVYSKWQEINEFTFMVTMIPALLALVLGGGAALLWTVWIIQFVRARKFLNHQKVIREITLDMRRREAEPSVKAM